jgi:hypothetical protein
MTTAFITTDNFGAELEKLLSDGDHFLWEAIGTALGQEIAEAVMPLKKQIAELKSAQDQFKFVGAFIEGEEYRRGNVVSLGGAIYSCRCDTKSKPTADNEAWLLVVPRARDGRDGKDLR